MWKKEIIPFTIIPTVNKNGADFFNFLAVPIGIRYLLLLSNLLGFLLKRGRCPLQWGGIQSVNMGLKCLDNEFIYENQNTNHMSLMT